MNMTRQDAWSKDEDILLAETVLRYIREGQTQLEAFKNVAKQLSRTSAACGFRWNATIRKQYHHAIQLAKEARKVNINGEEQHMKPTETNDKQASDPIDTAILLLKKLRLTDATQDFANNDENQKKLDQLQEENEALKKRLATFDSAWEEMGKLWMWVKENKV